MISEGREQGMGPPESVGYQVMLSRGNGSNACPELSPVLGYCQVFLGLLPVSRLQFVDDLASLSSCVLPILVDESLSDNSVRQ